MSEPLAKCQSPPAFRPLTPKRELFCQEYVKDMNGTQAAIRAGYSPHTANEQAARLLAISSVKSRVQELTKEKVGRIKIEQDDVLRELLAILKSTHKDYKQDADGNLTTVENPSNPDADRAVAGVRRRIKRHIDPFGEKEEIVQVEEVEYRLWDKNSAIQKAMKHLGLLEDKLSVKIEDPAGALAEVLGLKKEDLP